MRILEIKKNGNSAPYQILKNGIKTGLQKFRSR